MSRALHHVVSLFVVLALVAQAPSSLAAQAPSSLAAPAEVTFAEHVAPIVFRSCTSCHRPGEGAPFSLMSFADVRKRGRMIARVTQRRIMPPWLPVEGHGDFAGNLRLSENDIETIQQWVRAGTPEGDPAVTPALPEFAGGWQLGEPDLVVQMPAAFEVPAAGPDIYRNFALPLDLDEDKWVTAVEVRPGARSVLHHIIFEIDSTGRARELDGADGRPGFFGMGGGRAASRTGGGVSLGGWAVGGMPRHLPMGLAMKLPAGGDLVLRSHFHPSGKTETEQTTIGLHFTDRPPERTMVGLQLPPGFGIAAGLDVPPGEKNFTIGESFTLPVGALAVTVGGHAHMICREMQVFATVPGGQTESIFWIDNWDFDWQNRYQYREPLDLPAGTEIEAVITYDNSADNPDNPNDPPQRIRWGLQSTDEMGSVTLMLVAANERETPALRRAVRQHANQHFGRRGSSLQRGLGARLADRLRMLDHDGDGRIEGSELPDQYRRQLDRLDRNGDGAIDARELKALEAWNGRRGSRSP